VARVRVHPASGQSVSQLYGRVWDRLTGATPFLCRCSMIFFFLFSSKAISCLSNRMNCRTPDASRFSPAHSPRRPLICGQVGERRATTSAAIAFRCGESGQAGGFILFLQGSEGPTRVVDGFARLSPLVLGGAYHTIQTTINYHTTTTILHYCMYCVCMYTTTTPPPTHPSFPSISPSQ